MERSAEDVDHLYDSVLRLETANYKETGGFSPDIRDLLMHFGVGDVLRYREWQTLYKSALFTIYIQGEGDKLYVAIPRKIGKRPEWKNEDWHVRILRHENGRAHYTREPVQFVASDSPDSIRGTLQ